MYSSLSNIAYEIRQSTETLKDKKKLLYKKRRVLGDQIYDIKVFMEGDRMVITAVNTSTGGNIVIEVPKDKSNFI